jgi:shikimate dehydrogenase
VISGATQLIAHLGVPTEGFRAPLIYNPWFESKGIDAVVVPMGCESADYPSFLKLVFRLTNIRGALVTMPHKVTTAGLIDEPSPAVQICKACNAVKRAADGRLVGDMFDGEGFVRAMQAKGRMAVGASALVIGAGGVGSAIAASLAGAGVSRLALFDLDAESAAGLRSRLLGHYPQIEILAGRDDPHGFDIVVNATPLGLRNDDPVPVDAGRIGRSSFVGDVVMAAHETPLLALARQRGCLVQPGIDMLFEQIPAYLEFFGFPAATAAELRRLSGLTG